MADRRRDEPPPCAPEPANRGLFGPAQLIQIPGPNPILVPGEEGAWDEGLCYDTTDLCTLHHAPQPGATTRQTFELNPNVRFLKVLVENPHPARGAAGVKITATLGG